MPKRVIDYEALWASDKLAVCAAWAQPEYAWLYGLADCNGSFELTNLRVIWGRVAAVRKNLSLERLEQILDEFHDKGLLFRWEEGGKRYGHWTGSDAPGRLPPPSWRMRLERLAPPVPADALTKYMQQFANGPAALKAGLEAPQAQEEKKGLELDLEEKRVEARPSWRAGPLAYQGSCLRISAMQDAVLTAAFPWVERQAEYRKMNSWLEANPLRRPRNFSRFTHNWFNKIPPPARHDPAGGPASAPRIVEARVGLGPAVNSGGAAARVRPEYLARLRQREGPPAPDCHSEADEVCRLRNLSRADG